MRTNILLVLSVIVLSAFAGFISAAPAGADAGSGTLSSSAAGVPAPVSLSGGYSPVQITNTFGVHPDPRVLKVISLLEKKTDDPKVVDRLRQKLSRIGEKRLQMVSLLSDRILSREHEAEADVAFLLMTALIVFS